VEINNRGAVLNGNEIKISAAQITRPRVRMRDCGRVRHNDTQSRSTSLRSLGRKRRLWNRWEICLRMRYNLRGLRERDLGRVNIVI
jgi:hypothetical protein